MKTYPVYNKSPERPDYPYWPSMKTKHTIVQGIHGDDYYLSMFFATVVRVKGDDGLYRDIVCQKKMRVNIDNTDSISIIDKYDEAMKIAVMEFTRHEKLFIVDKHTPSTYQIDESLRLRALSQLPIPEEITVDD